jgi:hypothetical protein
VNTSSDFAHAAAVERILMAHGVTPLPTGSGERSHVGDCPLWGRGPAPHLGSQSLRAARPQSGGC